MSFLGIPVSQWQKGYILGSHQRRKITDINLNTNKMEIGIGFISGNTFYNMSVFTLMFTAWVSVKEQDSQKEHMPLTVQLFCCEAEIILRWIYLL